MGTELMAKSKEAAAFFISQKAVAELVGTYILVFFGCGSAFMEQRGNITLAGAALTWACAVGAVIYTIGHVSGAHINPAVTVAFATVGLFPWKQVAVYVMAQSVGSILASLTLQWLFGSGGASLMLTLPAGPNPAADLNVMAWEFIVTFVLLLVICSSALDPRAAKGFGGIAIGGAVFINITMAGPITGCSMNPARSFGPAVVNHNFRKLWICIVSR
ncbi:Aquaporin NIP1-1 [Platanthera zijinensis]|uniref:Aquaporin NIP1-1 n=1 Tax=Platanthera zijinensis TaxID=2320716 RepID=A0AAP0GDC3_9ASPA